MLCERCGERPATERCYFVTGAGPYTDVVYHGRSAADRPGRRPEPRPRPLPAPVEFVEPEPGPPPTMLCVVCARALVPPEIEARLAADAARRAAVPAGPAAPELWPLLDEVMRRSTDAPVDLPVLKAAVGELLAFLTGPEGWTAGNAAAVARQLNFDDGWRRVNRNRARWEYLPAPYGRLLNRLSILSEAFAFPERAERLELTPGELRAAARALPTNAPAT